MVRKIMEVKAVLARFFTQISKMSFQNSEIIAFRQNATSIPTEVLEFGVLQLLAATPL